MTMRRISQTWVMAFTAVILLTLANGAAWAALVCAPPSNPNNLVNAPIDVPLTNANVNGGGARWELCWENDAKKGLVLRQITLTPTPKPGAPRTLILQEASLAQVLVAYDNNSGNQHHVSDTGLPLTPLTAADCPGGTLLGGVVCQMVVPRGYAWRGSGQLQGKSLIIFGVSAAAGGGTYIHQWVFSDDGSIHAMLGVSGQLDPSRDSTIPTNTGWPISAPTPTRYATNRFHTAYWRLDFALDGQNNDLFQQLEYKADSSNSYMINQTITNITSESQFNISPGTQRFWVVKDTATSTLNGAAGQKISFQIVPQHTSLQRGSDAFTKGDVYVTQNKACEQFASGNPIPSPNPLGCGVGLPQFVNGEAISDLVVWVGSTWHQVPRAEDESAIQTHWQGFFLAPRDLTATSPL
jgi:primary-amine oxidase